MKKLKSLLLFLALFTIFCISSLAAIQRDINITPPLGGVGACKENIFTVAVKAQGARLKITADINYSFTTTPSCSTATPVYIIPYSITGNTSNPYFDVTTHSWSVAINDTGTVTIHYYVYIDCSIIPSGNQTGTVALQQTFNDSTGVYQFDTDPSPTSTSNLFIIPNINVPQLVDVSLDPNLSPYQSGYLDTLNIYFYYKNASNDTASIQFTFTDDATHYCSNTQLISLMARNTPSGSFNSFTSGSTVNVSVAGGDTLVIRKRVRSLQCLNSCNGKTVSLSWRCNTTAPAHGVFCSNCKAGNSNSFVTTYRIIPNDIAALHITRILPDSTLYNYSCMNDPSMLRWKFFITNTGKGALDTATVQLNSGSGYNFLTLIPDSSLHITVHCNSCDTSLTTKADSASLCSVDVPNPLSKATLSINDFRVTDTVFVEFSTYRCSEENDTLLLNADKEYFKTTLNAFGNIICPSASVQASSNFFTHPYIDPNAGSIPPDVEQKLAFFPSVTDLIVDPGNTYGDSTTQQIEMHGYLNQIYDYQIVHAQDDSPSLLREGIIRATLYCDTNMRVQFPFTDARLKWLNPATNSYVYKYADTMITKIPVNSCESGNYYYFFDLRDSIMRLMLDSGQFEFTMQACCAFEKARTPYHVNFHLLAVPSGNCNSLTFANDTAVCTGTGCAWLPLSGVGDEIAVHCPGCLYPGIVAQYYKMERVSLGLQDSDNDGIADVGNIAIDTASSWYASNASKLKTNYSSLGDRLQDKFTARFEPGNPAGGGYSYHNEMTNLGVRFKYLQLSREIQAAFDTMKLTVNNYTLYIDTADAVNAECRDCQGYGLNPALFRTQLILTVPQDSIYLFLDTITHANTFLFNFSAYDSASAFYGNLFSHPSLITYTDTIHPFTGFGENQRYRLVTNYTECGSFAAPSLPNLQLTDVMQQSLIRNNCWLTGAKQAYSAFDDNLRGPNTKAQALDSGYVFSTPVPPGKTLINQSYANKYIFVCETYSGTHYYFAQNAGRQVTVNADTGCTKAINIISRLSSAGGIYDYHPYEFKTPSYFPQSYFINIPSGYHSKNDTAYVRHYVYIGNSGYYTPFIPFQLPSGNTFVINESSLPAPQCIDENYSNTDSALYIAGTKAFRQIYIPTIPDSCFNDTLFNPADSMAFVQYGIGGFGCVPTIACTADNSFDGYLTNKNPFVQVPNLSFSYSNSFQANQRIVCSTVSFSNNGTYTFNGTNYNYDDAAFVYIALPTTTPYLNNWQFINGNDTISAIGSIIPVATALNHNTTLNGKLCATNSYCLNHPDSFIIQWGWSCDTFPTTAFNPLQTCFSRTDSIWFSNGDVVVGITTKEHDSTYTLCQSYEVTTTLTSSGHGAVYPNAVAIQPLPQGLTVQHVVIQNCNNVLFDTLSIDTIPNRWVITDANMFAIGYPGSAMADSACISVKVWLLPECSYIGNNVVPPITIYLTSYCGDSITQQTVQGNNENRYVLPTLTDSITWNGNSQCTNCFSITKTANKDTIAVGDTVTFTIQVCSHNGSTQAVIVKDILPSAFSVYTNNMPATPPYNINLAAGACTTFTVTGKYTSTGLCPNAALTNKAFAINSATDTVFASACVNVIAPCWSPGTEVWVNNTNSSTLNPSYINKNIIVQDTLIISDSLYLQNCRVFTYAGAYINITSTGYLLLDSTVIEGCNTMWRGITTEQFSRLKINEYSRISDANIAVFAKNKSNVWLINSSKLTNNVIGIRVPNKTGGGSNNVYLEMDGSAIGMYASAFKPFYAGQLIDGISPGVIPKAGIDLQDGVFNFNPINRNTFYNMCTGITGRRTNITISNTDFYRMQKYSPYGLTYSGAAIASQGTSDAAYGTLTVFTSGLGGNNVFVDSCNYGIYSEFTELYAESANIQNAEWGIYAYKCGTHSAAVYGCNITARSYGVQVTLSPNAPNVDVSYNTIKVNKGSSSKAISFDQASSTNTHPYIAYQNQIEAVTGAGIYCANIKNAQLTENIIKLSGNTSGTGGITLSGADSSVVQCNNIIGKYPTLNYTNKGIFSSISKNNTIACNIVDSTYRGIEFGGVCIGTKFRSNEMKKHYIGLYLNNTAAIDTQTHAGNKWIGSYNSSYGAWNENWIPVGNLFYSLFLVDPALGSIFNPTIPTVGSGGVPNDQGWFQPASGSTYSCPQNSCQNSSSLMSQGSSKLMQYIVKDSTLSSEFIPETKQIAQMELFELVKRDSFQYANDGLLMQFLNTEKQTSIGKLSEVKEDINNASLPVNTTNVAGIINSLQSNAISIRILDSLSKANPLVDNSAARQVLVNDRDMLQQQLQNNYSIYDKLNKLNTAEAKNDAITTTQFPDEFEKTINEANIAFERDGITGLQPYVVSVFEIANQCPYLGGTAVYKARVLMQFIDPSLDYDDESVCLQQGIYRIAKDKQESKLPDQVTIVPNPANDIVKVFLSSRLKGMCKVEFKNTVGQVVINAIFDCEKKEQTIDVKSLSQGIYGVYIFVNDKTILADKIIISR